MVRFARADGSKGSNKRLLEEATPWVEMVEQLESSKEKTKTKKKLKGKSNKDDTLEETLQKKRKIVASDQDIKSQKNIQSVKEQKDEVHKEERQEQTQVTQGIVRNKKEKGLRVMEPEYTITSEGKKVKVFRDGTQRTWFDLPYEESDLMTRYEGFWVKQEMVSELDRLKDALQEEGLDKKAKMKKMMKAKRKAHRKLRIELIYQQKKIVSDATGENLQDCTNPRSSQEKNYVTSSKKSLKQKPVTLQDDSLFSQSKLKHVEKECNSENVYPEQLPINEEETDCSEREGNSHMKELTTNLADVKRKKKEIKDSVHKVMESNDPKKNKLESCMTKYRIDTDDNIAGEDNMKETVIQQDNSTVKKRKKTKKDKVKKEEATTQNDQENCEVEQKIITDTLKEERKNKMCESVEVLQLQSEINKSNSQCNEAESCNFFSKKNLIQNQCYGKTADKLMSHCSFEENELMTNYDGYWVLHEDVENLDAAKETELAALYAARTDGAAICKGELTQEEQLALQRAMKKKKRFHHRKLLLKLSNMGKKVDSGRKKGNAKRKLKKDEDEKVAKFDGFWVKKEAADRLHKLRIKLHREGLSRQEVDSLVQKERRKEERVLKNERKLVCLNCREPGHMVSACPNIVQAEGEGQPSICYTCGSTEHTSSTCNLRKGSEKSFSFATCYICQESGHISRQCPDNPRGLYPKGGACRGCGSVEHLAKDCPDLQKEKEQSSIRVGRLKGEELEALDAEEEEFHDENETSSYIKQSVSKVVKFL